MWRANDKEALRGFLEELYEEQEDSDFSDDASMTLEGDEDEFESIEDDCRHTPSPEVPHYSPLTSPSLRRRPSGDRDRSRSPLRGERSFDSRPIVIKVFDSTPLLEGDMLAAAEDAEDFTTFLTPDAHALYYSRDTNERNESDTEDRPERNVRARRNVKVRVRGERSGRAEGRGRAGRGRGGRRLPADGRSQWVAGSPLEEIWLTDDDVPPSLLEMVRDVMNRRAQRALMNERRTGRMVGERVKTERGNDSEIEDVFEDASEGTNSNPILGSQDLRFEWFPMESFQGTEEIFTPERIGSVENQKSPYDAFRSYWDDDIIQYIADATNRYASRIASAAFQSDWFPTNSHEVLCLFAFWMMLGIIRMPTIKSCFSTDPTLRTEVFRRMFTLRRYTALVRALNFESGESYASSDRLYSLRPILTHLNAKFQANYIPSKDICIDASVTHWKGRLNIKQHIRSKAAKCGIKTFELCESATGYLWSFLVYTGGQTNIDLLPTPGVLKSTSIVMKLIKPLLNKGYRLFMDNWYNCPQLARFLKRNGTDCVGILQPNCPDVPVLLTHAPLKQGQLIARHSGDITILSWQDKKRITMISTCHGSAIGLPKILSKPSTWPLAFKPQVVLDYNRSTGGVDLKDQILEPYLLERKRCTKWYMKLFKRLLNVSILNARILLESSTKSRREDLSFRLQLVDTILSHHLSLSASSTHSSHSHSRYIQPLSSRDTLSHTHWPVRNKQRESDRGRNRQSRAICRVCALKGGTQKTAYKCETCDVALCVENCFKEYHVK